MHFPYNSLGLTYVINLIVKQSISSAKHVELIDCKVKLIAHQSVSWLCGWRPLILSYHPAKFGVHRPYGTGHNVVCNIDSNSNSNSNAEVPMPRFTNGPFKQRETSLLWSRHYAISINLIVGSYVVASIKTLKFISAAVYEIKRGNQYLKKEKYPYSEDVNAQ